MAAPLLIRDRLTMNDYICCVSSKTVTISVCDEERPAFTKTARPTC